MESRDEDVHALGLILRQRCSAPSAPHGRSLGLEPEELAGVLDRWFPGIATHWDPRACLAAALARREGRAHHCPAEGELVDPGYGRFSRNLLQQEEADLRQLFLDHGGNDGPWPPLFARLIARACMESEHLWLSLGLEDRRQLTGILDRHFPALAAKNSASMRWKRFFYRLLCDCEKVWACSSPSCAVCAHRDSCYVGEN